MTRFRWLIGVLAAGTTVMILTGPAAVAIAATTLAWSPETGTKLEAEQPGLFTALQRDLNLDRDEAIARVGRSETAHRIHDRLRLALGQAYAGAWLDPDGAQLTVAVADRRLTGVVRAAGARPQVVAHPLADLQSAVDRMSTTGLPEGIQSWYVDQAANNIVVETSHDGRTAAATMVSRAGVDPDLVRFVISERQTSPIINVYGGDFETRAGCTIGFGVRRIFAPGITGFLTAGHCGPVDQTVSMFFVPMGKVAQSTFNDISTGPDQAWARIDNTFLFQATSEINTFKNGMLATVTGPVTLLLGDYACMAGAISKFQCGNVEATNVPMLLTFKVGSDTFITRTVTGLTRTNFCSVGGDSGAPVVGVGNQAAGIMVAGTTIGGIGSCGLLPNGPSYYQPVEPMLNDFQLQLIPPRPAPRPVALNIDSGQCDREATGPGWVCYVRWAGGVDPATARWSVNVPRPAPYVVTDSSSRMTEAHFACFFNEAEPDYFTQVTIRDAAGAQVSWGAFVCQW
jgi:streptogrisin C